MAIIDADAHVVENEHTWDYADESERDLMPQVVVMKKGGAFLRATEWWMIEGRVFPKNANIGSDTTEGTREASDVAARIAHMDELGVDTHILYPTIFLRPLTRRPETELALCRSYNRWVSDIHDMGKGRLRWTAILPLMSMDESLEELHWAKEHGACGVFMRNGEHDKRMGDSYFFPLYREAGKLDMPICFHSSQGNFNMWDLLARDSGFSQFKLTIVGTFHDLLMKGIPEKFPDVRWGFVEVSSQWVPYALNDAQLRLTKQGKRWLGADTLKENNMFVACQTTDDLDYVLEHAGEGNIMLGTDYGHNDTSSELLALQRLREDGKVNPEAVDKILGDNPQRFYAL